MHANTISYCNNLHYIRWNPDTFIGIGENKKDDAEHDDDYVDDSHDFENDNDDDQSLHQDKFADERGGGGVGTILYDRKWVELIAPLECILLIIHLIRLFMKGYVKTVLFEK